MATKKISLPEKITLDVLRRDTLEFININNLTQTEFAYSVGCYPCDISHFLAGRTRLSLHILDLINMLYF